MKNLLILVIAFFAYTMNGIAQEEKEDNVSEATTEIEKATETNVLVGKIQLKQLYAFPEFDFESTYEFDDAEHEQLTIIAKALKNYDMLVFLGTWCSDSHELIPELVAVMNELKLRPSQYLLYALDESKNSPEGLEKTMNVQFVPTILLIDKETKKEVGRIVENAPNGIINELIQIIE